jgi:uncharacterized protein YcbX
MTSQITHLLRYPVKGLAGQQLAETWLEKDQRLAGDRLYAACHTPDTRQEETGWRPKTAFWQVYNSPALAALDCQFSADGTGLQLPAPEKCNKGPAVRQMDLTHTAGRQQLARFLSSFLTSEETSEETSKTGRDNPELQIIRCSEGGFTDVRKPYISIASQASVAQLCGAAGVAADYRRFRMNIWLDGLPAFAELDWVGKRLRLGRAELEIAETVGRCAATHANPHTGQTDCDLVRLSGQLYGHSQLGVYARVVSAGMVRPGDQAELL